MSGLAVEQLCKRYGDKEILRGVDLKISEGEFLSLLGPSGCGKTTTLNVVAGFVEPDAGRVLIGGTDATKQPPYRRDTAIVFQNYALFPHMTVADNIGYGLRARKRPKPEIAQRVGEVMGLMSISELADRYPAQLSGGQQQRVAVARAVVVRPGVLLMDEPLSNLDVKLRQEIRVELRALQQRLEQTVLFVTHDQEEALTMSDRIGVVNEGVIEQIGAPEEVYEQPETVFVADFMGVKNIFAVGAGSELVRKSLGVPDRFSDDYLGIRPGAVVLQPREGATAGGDGVTVLARVERRIYRGAVLEYELTTDDGQTHLVVEQTRTSGEFQPGDSVTAHVAADALLHLRPSAGSTAREAPAGQQATVVTD